MICLEFEYLSFDRVQVETAVSYIDHNLLQTRHENADDMRFLEDFAKKYGDHGKDFIEVHHLKAVSGNLDRVQVNPDTDLVVVCSNCHRMIHRRKSNILSLQDLRKLIKSQT